MIWLASEDRIRYCGIIYFFTEIPEILFLGIFSNCNFPLNRYICYNIYFFHVSMKILVLNAWSSSLKYQLFDMKKNVVLIKWIIERIWVKGSSIKNHKMALKSIFPALAKYGPIDAIGHRVVHGGEYFKNPVVINANVIKRIEECSDLAPLHNPANLQAILACKELMPKLKQVAVFDTAFYQSMEPSHYLYAIPYGYYAKNKIRRYWFHGTSHQYVYEKARVIVKKWKKFITCHVGNGVSVTAIKDGKVLETSMWMTPLEWTMMGTRSGNIDPAIFTYLVTHYKMTVQEIDDMLNKKSWLLGVSWVSSDMRDILTGIKKWNKKCMLALDMYIHSLVKYIWAYVALLGWVDVIVLTAGVMEHRAIIRKMLCEKLWYLWIKIDAKANVDELPEGKIISARNSNVTVVVIPTNEELMIAKQTFDLI